MREIFLTQGVVSIVDDCDFDEISKFKWHPTKGYAARKGSVAEGCRTVRMHRQIIGLQFGDGLHIDHINGNKLDNRRGNLRVCSARENTRNRIIHSNNTSGFKGVTWNAKLGKWRASITFNYIRKHLGYFALPEDAHAAYCAAAADLFGDFARFS